MSNGNNAYLKLELVWWLITAIIAALVLSPIWLNLPNFPFYVANLVFIVTFVTLTRYIFLLRFTFLGNRQILKIALVFVCIPLVFYLIQTLNHFQTFLDEEGVEAIVGDLPFLQQQQMIDYVRSEMILFGVGSIVSGFVFPFRLLISVWRLRNRGTI